MIDDASSSLPLDSFRYIHMLLEALDRAGCLDVAVDRIEQRLPVELFTIVDRTNQEVDLRHPAHIRDAGRLDHILSTQDFHNTKRRTEILEDLLWTLFSKFEAVAEGHRVVHDVILGIARRNGLRQVGPLTGSFKELWKLYQSEVRDTDQLKGYILSSAATLAAARLYCDGCGFIVEAWSLHGWRSQYPTAKSSRQIKGNQDIERVPALTKILYSGCLSWQRLTKRLVTSPRSKTTSIRCYSILCPVWFQNLKDGQGHSTLRSPC